VIRVTEADGLEQALHQRHDQVPRVSLISPWAIQSTGGGEVEQTRGTENVLVREPSPSGRADIYSDEMAGRSPKVGALDDPVWAEPPPSVPVHRRPNGRIRVRRPVVAVIGLVVLLVVGGVAFRIAQSGPSGGDPGGRILSQLKPTSVAVPPTAPIGYANYVEPRMDSCDGRAGTQGWGDAVVQIYFQWNGSPSALLSYANGRLSQLGWGAFRLQTQNGIPGGDWIKQLNNGSVAQVRLGAESYGGWTLFATAPPVGRRASGC
jgi:hypothetical protein